MGKIYDFFYDLAFDYGALFSKESLSAVLGAVVGGIIAAGIQVIALREARNVRDHDRLLTRQAMAHSLIFKMTRIYSDAVHVNRWIEGGFAGALEQKLGGDPWMFVRPFGNRPERINFSSDEMGMLLSLKDPDLFNLVRNQDVCHNSLNDIIELYDKCRRDLTDQLTHNKVDGDKMSGSFSPEERMKLMPRIIDANQLIDAIRWMSRRNVDEGKQSVLGLQRVFNEKLRLELKANFEDAG